MLTLKSEVPTQAETVREFHRHVPISLNRPNLSDENPLYWRQVDGDLALLEIGIDRSTGAFRSLTLVSYLGATTLIEAKSSLDSVKEYFLPLFDLSLWPDRSRNRTRFDYYDWENPLRLELSFKEAILHLSTSSVHTSYNLDPRLMFGFDESRVLCRVSILELADREMHALRTGLGR